MWGAEHGGCCVSVLLAWPPAAHTDLVKWSHLTSPALRCLLALISFLPSPSHFFLAFCFFSFSHRLLSPNHHPFLQVAGLSMVWCFWGCFAGTETLCFSSALNVPPSQQKVIPPPLLLPVPDILALYPTGVWGDRWLGCWAAPSATIQDKYSLGCW